MINGQRKAPNAANIRGANFNDLSPNYRPNVQKLPPTTREVFTNFRQAIIENIGHAPSEIEASGKIEKFSSNGEKQDKAGWYVCHEYTILMTDKQTGETVPHWGLVGVYGDWRQFGDAKFKWNSFSQYFELSREEKARIESRQRELAAKQKAERQARAETAQSKAVNWWRTSTPADPSHPYLLKKRVGAYGIRQRGEMLLVPVCDLDGVLHGLQFIAPDGNKPYLTGTQPTGKFCLVGQALTHPQGVYLCEGYATAASLHEVYGLPVLSCFAKHNLLPVAQAYRERFPHIPLTICADNDRDPDSTGYRGGELEARKVCATLPGVSLMIPEFPEGAPLKLSDFNDLVSLLGSSGEKEPML